MDSGYYKPIVEVKSGEKLYGGNTVVSNEFCQSKLIEIETTLGYVQVLSDQQFVMNDGSIKKAKDLKRLDVIAPISVPIESRRTTLTDDELKFFGAWLANGLIKKDNVIGFLIHKPDSYQKIKALNISFKNTCSERQSITINQKKHKELTDLIFSLDQGVPLLEFGYEEYPLIYEGFLMIRGHVMKGDQLYSYTKNKNHSLFIQYCSILDGQCFKIGRWESKMIGYFGEPIHRTHMVRTPNKSSRPIATVLSLKNIDQGVAYRLRVDNDHSFFADNLCFYGE